MWNLSHGEVLPYDFSNQTVNVVESGYAGQTVVGTMYYNLSEVERVKSVKE